MYSSDLTIRINAISIMVISLKQNPEQEFQGLVLTVLQKTIHDSFGENLTTKSTINKVKNYFIFLISQKSR